MLKRYTQTDRLPASDTPFEKEFLQKRPLTNIVITLITQARHEFHFQQGANQGV